jgi:hypothetical protein
MIWLFRLNYILNHLMIKLSILLFYKYIASSHKSFRRLVNIMIAISTILSLVMVCASIFICTPVEDAWSAQIYLYNLSGIKVAHCPSPRVLWLSNASFNLATDVFIWLLPLPFVWRLRSMPVKRRLELIATFSIGILAITASAVRLHILARWLSGFNESGAELGNIIIWSQVEQHAGIIAGSIPFLRPLIRKLMRVTRSQDLEQNSSPAEKCFGDITPDNPNMPRTSSTIDNQNMPRNPIITSQTPTHNSDRGFQASQYSLSPISPVRSEMLAVHTV